VANSTDPQVEGIPARNELAPPGRIVEAGLVRAAPLSVLMEEERQQAQDVQAQPLTTGVAAHIQRCWSEALTAKQMTVEERMLQSMRARRGEYDPDKLAMIREMGGSEIYANLTSVKCRGAASWLRDVMMATGSERPWTIRPTPVATLPPDLNERIVQAVAQPVTQATLAGQPPTDDQILELMESVRDQAHNAVQERATQMADRMADKMEDQLVEGGFMQALDQFIDDITTFPAAILKGPIIRKKKMLKWVQGKDGYEPQVVEDLGMEWRRVSPFDIYPSPAATDIDDGYLIEKHRLSREDLTALIGVEGYDEASIRMVLEQYGDAGLSEMQANDSAIADAEGKSTSQIMANTDGLIDALQFWGPVSGKMLVEWGLDEKEVPDQAKEYHVEAWLIGSTVIKAVLNYDPLCRKPYYKTSYEEIPGAFWGNSVADLIRDPQQMCNASARAIVNNMGIASGPQVAINIDRLAPGEELTTLTPWRIWQLTNDPTGSGAKPIEFYQPDSRVAELMAIFEKFNVMADEYSGLPRYMAGSPTAGVGRTASGLSMLMSNAGKAIKQVVANVDTRIMTPLIERLYDHNMIYSDDPELKGDVQIVARGAASLVNKENAQLRRNEFLQATANPIDMQIVGIQGRAELLREAAKNLDMNPDRVVPPMPVLQQKLLMAQMMAQGQGGKPGLPAPPAKQMGSGQELMDGSPQTDNYSPPAQ
jgi:hypothetical protein